MENTLEKIYKAGLKFLAPLTPEETYPTIVHEAVRLVGGNGGIIMLQHEGNLQIAYHFSPVPSLSPQPRRNGLAYRTLRTNKAYVAGTSEIHPESARMGIKSVVFIPLAYRNKSIGVLAVRSYKENYFNTDMLKTLQLFGSMASLAIRKSQLYDETLKALKTRDLFLSMAAHEFRTPLTTIGGYAQLLVNKLSGKNPQSKWVQEMYWEVNRLASLVNELLEASRIKEGRFNYVLRRCNLKEITEKGIIEFKFNHPDRQVIFHGKLKGSEVIVGDFDKLLQMIDNLIDNAAKFSDPSTKITITLSSLTSHLKLTVSDQGRGISKEAMPRIFEGFYRGHKSEQRGMGLGLFLAKNIIDAHHGIISVRSKIDKGTVVEVKLPKVRL